MNKKNCDDCVLLETISSDIKGLDGRLDSVGITLIKQSKDLEYHIERTDMLQTMVEPVYQLRLQLIGVVKFVTVVAAVGGCGWIFTSFLGLL